MLMKSRKSFNLSISFSSSLKFKNVSNLEFTCNIQMCVKLLHILTATPWNTSCVERGYSFLQMVCAPRRNHLKLEHLKTLFLLAALLLPVKKDSHGKIKIFKI